MKRIFVKNLPYAYDEDEIWDLFIPFGKVISIEIQKDPLTGDSLGKACVNMDNVEPTVLSLHGKEIGNRILHLSVDSGEP